MYVEGTITVCSYQILRYTQWFSLISDSLTYRCGGGGKFHRYETQDLFLQLVILFITDVWREYLHYEGLDVTLQLVIPSGDLSLTTASSLVDNNVNTCMNTDLCPNNGEVSL